MITLPVAKDRIPEVLAAISARVRGFPVPPPEAPEAPAAKRGGLSLRAHVAKSSAAGATTHEIAGVPFAAIDAVAEKCKKAEVRRHGLGAAGAEHAAGRPYRASDDSRSCAS